MNRLIVKVKKTANVFSNEQMEQIRQGFENGLTMEQVKSYADPKLNRAQMQDTRFSYL